MDIWTVSAVMFIFAQLLFYSLCTPERKPRPITPSRLNTITVSMAYGLAYGLSILRLPFAILPYSIKVFGALILKKHYTVAHYVAVIEALRIGGELINWMVGFVVIEQIGLIAPVLKLPLYVSLYAEALRLFAEKGQIAGSVGWQTLPHRRIAAYLTALIQTRGPVLLNDRLNRYCQYYSLTDEQRIQYILGTLHAYAAADQEALTKLGYLSTLRIVPQTQGLRGGHVRNVARGEVFIHRQWTSDPWLLIGQSLRRTPWQFDPRFLRRPFYYRTESNRLSTFFVLTHARYCPTYALYQFGHEIKSARYDFFYRLFRWLNLNIEPKVQADGTFPFDQGITWVRHILFSTPYPSQSPLWADEDVLTDVRRRIACGETLQALDIAEQYTYPLKYVEEVLLDVPDLIHSKSV